MTITNEEQPNLNVEFEYVKEDDIIVLTLNQDDRLIKVGFNLQEAQIFQSHLAETILTALEVKLGLTPAPPQPPETRH